MIQQDLSLIDPSVDTDGSLCRISSTETEVLAESRVVKLPNAEDLGQKKHADRRQARHPCDRELESTHR